MGIAWLPLAIVLLGGCKKDFESPTDPRARPALPDARPPQFKPNLGGAILERSGVTAGPPDGGDWPGKWTGTMHLTGGPVSGALPTTMEITRRRDGTLRLFQSELGITIVQDLVVSPDNPNLAAGINYDVRHVNTVTFRHRQEITAIRTGDQIAIGMVVDTEDAGSYRGTPIPKGPPQESLTRLERKTRYLSPFDAAPARP